MANRDAKKAIVAMLDEKRGLSGQWKAFAAVTRDPELRDLAGMCLSQKLELTFDRAADRETRNAAIAVIREKVK